MKQRYDAKFLISLIDESDHEYQPRLEYDEDAIGILSRDIDKNGQHNPVGLFQKGESCQIIYGFQRVIALKRLGRETIRANIYEDASWEELHEQSISNNERHLDLNDLEKALYVKALKDKGFSVERLGELFGVKKSAIYNYLTVSRLDETTRECLQRRLISINHAVELARCDDFSKRLEKLRAVLGYDLSVAELKAGTYTRKLGVHWWVQVCPTDMRMKISNVCEACQYFKGENGEDGVRFVNCDYPQDNFSQAMLKLFAFRSDFADLQDYKGHQQGVTDRMLNIDAVKVKEEVTK